MKKLLLTTAIIFAISASTYSPAFAAIAKVEVNGLVCDFCARALEKVFSKQEAVENIDVNLDTKIITISFKDGQSLDDTIIADLIKDSGYDVQGITHEE